MQTICRISDVVTPFLDNQYLPIAMAISQAPHYLSNFPVAFHGQALSSIGIKRTGILADHKKQQLRLKLINRWNNQLVHRIFIPSISTSIRQRYIEIVPKPLALTNLIDGATLRMRWPPRTMHHVKRHRQHGVCPIEALRGAIPVVHINIHNGDLCAPGIQSQLHSKSGIVQKAVAIGVVGLRVVARGANQRVGQVPLPV
uniref:Uncharacterized protein n=1 Tax=Zea mays TaxID=4577 RepID=C4IYR2_MAIZE|nr:unknown [Zea mays]